MNLPYQPESATSKAAADSMSDEALTQQERILKFMVKRGTYGATRDEASAELDILMASVSARFNRFISHRVFTVTKDTRPTRSGRQAEVVVWAEALKPKQSNFFAEAVEPRRTQYS